MCRGRRTVSLPRALVLMFHQRERLYIGSTNTVAVCNKQGRPKTHHRMTQDANMALRKNQTKPPQKKNNNTKPSNCGDEQFQNELSQKKIFECFFDIQGHSGIEIQIGGNFINRPSIFSFHPHLTNRPTQCHSEQEHLSGLQRTTQAQQAQTALPEAGKRGVVCQAK